MEGTVSGSKRSIKLIQLVDKDPNSKQGEEILLSVPSEAKTFSGIDAIEELRREKVKLEADSSLGFTRWNLIQLFARRDKEPIRLPLFVDLLKLSESTSSSAFYFRIPDPNSLSQEDFVSIDFGRDLFIQVFRTKLNLFLRDWLSKELSISSSSVRVSCFDPDERKLSSSLSLEDQSVSKGSLLKIRDLDYEDTVRIKATILKEESSSLERLLNYVPSVTIKIVEVPKVIFKEIEKPVSQDKQKDGEEEKESWIYSDQPFFQRQGIDYFLVYGRKK